jgi:uncharacterized protein with PQ loop repeat
MTDVTTLKEYCQARGKLMHLESEHKEECNPLREQLATIRTNLRKYLEDHSISCIPIDIQEKDLLTGEMKPSRRLLKLKTTSKMNALELSGIEKAVLSITPQDLESEYKQMKEKKKKDINLYMIWESVLSFKIREVHSIKTQTFAIDSVPKKPSKQLRLDPIVPPSIVSNMVQQYVNLSNTLSNKNETYKQSKLPSAEVIEKHTQNVTQHLQTGVRAEKGLEVNMRINTLTKPINNIPSKPLATHQNIQSSSSSSSSFSSSI